MITKPMREMINPAIANPLGLLKRPTIDRTNPTNQHNHPIMGSHDKKMATIDKINPVNPIGFFSIAG